MSAIVIIPARYASTRFPGKPLAPLKGKPIIQHVYENSKGSSLADKIIVATDNKEIFDTVLSFGGEAVMTKDAHVSGTDRVAEACLNLDYDIIVNVQGDEPLIRPEMIDSIIKLLGDRRADISTLARRITNPHEVFDPNVVKVVFDPDGFALYFSRSPIPYNRDLWKDMDKSHLEGAKFDIFKHIGIYGYKKQSLIKMSSLPESRLEAIERLEQLRAMENGMRIKVGETQFETVGVDTPEDLRKMEGYD